MSKEKQKELLLLVRLVSPTQRFGISDQGGVKQLKLASTHRPEVGIDPGGWPGDPDNCPGP
jgi:hypothetical protein